MTGRPRGGARPRRGWRCGAAVLAACALLGSGAAWSAPRTRVVVFPFAARSAEQRIYEKSLAQAVARALDGALLEARVVGKRPAGDAPAGFAAAAREQQAALAVAGDVGPGTGDEVVLRGLLVDVRGGTAVGRAVETRAQLERLDQGAAVLGAAIKAQAEAWLQRPGPASRPHRPLALVYGVDAPLGADGTDARIAATKTAYRFVRSELRHRPVAAATYGLVPARVAAAAAGEAGCAGAIMLRIERLTFPPGGVPTAVARVTLRTVSADARVVRERTLVVTVPRRAGEGHVTLTTRVVAETFGRTIADLREALAPRTNP